MDKLSLLLVLLGLLLIISFLIYFKLRSIDWSIDKVREYIRAYMQRGSRDEDIHHTLKRIEDIFSKS